LLQKVQTLRDLNEVIADLPDIYKEWMERAIPRSEFKEEKNWIESVKSKILDMLVQHRLVVILQLESQEFKAFKAGEVRELTSKKIAVDERLDARIDRALKRLAQLKTFKQMLEDQASHAKTINGRRISDQR
jgi:ArsR family metal-binding transcriptional regulator